MGSGQPIKIHKYLSPGVLERYICGALTKENSQKVYRELNNYPEIKNEAEKIETLRNQVTAVINAQELSEIQESARWKIEEHYPYKRKKKKRKNYRKWVSYIGWIISVVLLIGIISLIIENKQLIDRLEKAPVEQSTNQ